MNRERVTSFFASFQGIVLTGVIIGVAASLLQFFGNPANMGICVACFERDIAGALGLHRAAVVQYMRPEIVGFVLGSTVAALLFREFRGRSGSAPVVRFFLGVFAMIGALVFLGCPWRALLRLAGGDLNALVGIAGLAAGIALGVQFLKKGYSLGRSRTTGRALAWVMPIFMVLLLVLRLISPKTGGGALFFSETGPGSLFAPVGISLGIALVIGFLAQRSRFCTMGALRDVILMRDAHLLSGVDALVVSAFVMNLLLGQFNGGMMLMPVAHSAHLWNFLGMALAGLAFALAGGCPGRQLFLAGEGDGDAAVFVLGMIVGAGISHNFSLAGAPNRLVDGQVLVGGIGTPGIIALAVGFAFCLFIGFAMREE